MSPSKQMTRNQINTNTIKPKRKATGIASLGPATRLNMSVGDCIPSLCISPICNINSFDNNFVFSSVYDEFGNINPLQSLALSQTIAKMLIRCRDNCFTYHIVFPFINSVLPINYLYYAVYFLYCEPLKLTKLMTFCYDWNGIADLRTKVLQYGEIFII